MNVANQYKLIYLSVGFFGYVDSSFTKLVFASDRFDLTMKANNLYGIIAGSGWTCET